MLAQQALRAGLDPLSVLRPGDPFEKLLERELIRRDAEQLAKEQVELAKLHGVIAGQVMALSMGAPPETVIKVGQALMEGGPDER